MFEIAIGVVTYVCVASAFLTYLYAYHPDVEDEEGLSAILAIFWPIAMPIFFLGQMMEKINIKAKEIAKVIRKTRGRK